MSTEEITVQSWNDLLEQLYADSWQPEIKRHRSPYVFRGRNDAGDTLQTSLMRLGGNYERMENHLLRNFRKYASRSVVEQDTVWHWLSLGQHHGLPTRLLDWTLSPLVAAHFATDDTREYDRPAAIWMVDSRRCHAQAAESLRADLEREGADFFTVEMLARAFPHLSDLDALAQQAFVLFFEPPSIDDRIVNQFAVFSVMPSVRTSLSDWLNEQPPGLCRKLVIPPELKWEVRDKLDQSNITERVLFPGPDGLSRWQKRYYTPRE
jgi:hypothetical protein